MVNSTANTHFIDAQVLGPEVKTVFENVLFMQTMMFWDTDFDHGTSKAITNIGQLSVNTRSEGDAPKFQPITTNNEILTVDRNKESAARISMELLQDALAPEKVRAHITHEVVQALARDLEVDILSLSETVQTLGNANLINGTAHRLIGQRLANTNQVIQDNDLLRMKHAFSTASAPKNGRAIMFAHEQADVLESFTTFISRDFIGDSTPVVDGFSDQTRAFGRLRDFTLMSSQYVNTLSAAETIGSESVKIGAHVNIGFMSNPSVGGNKDLSARDATFHGVSRAPIVTHVQEDNEKHELRYNSWHRYGLRVNRPETLVTLLTDASFEL